MSARDIWLVRLATWVLRLLASTWNVHWVNAEVTRDINARGSAFIYALWHGQLLPLLWTHRHRGVAVMISEHRDGERIARVADILGFRLVRGSTSRGAARALLEGSRAVERGHNLAITLDGPRGPAGSIAPGALVIAQRGAVPIVPVGVAVTSAWRLRSWDRFMIPKPFARVSIAYGTPIEIAAESPRDAIEWSDELREAMNRAFDAAERSRARLIL